ncbi:MAG: hypothetical protein RBU45_07545 [Myxococcota bacterium]|nr:hypothetical protein [Myxococcota bacterium]
MPSRILAAILLLLLAGAGRPALASGGEVALIPGPVDDPPRHLLAELGLGSTTFGGGGFASSFLFGGGGPLGSLPLRLYLVGEVAFLLASDAGETGLGLAYTESRRYGDLMLGVRLQHPLYEPLSLFTQVQVGGSAVSARLERETLASRVASGWTFLAELTLGLQLRLLPLLSCGLHFSMALNDEDVAGLRWLVGAAPVHRSWAGGSLTWHF